MEEEQKEEILEEKDEKDLKIEELEDQYKRLMAEFDNFKKRNSKERDFLYNSLIIDVVTSFLPIVDNLEKAVQVETTDESYKQGVEMVLKQFLDVFKYYKVEIIEAIGTTFDPELHEAVSHVEDTKYKEQEVIGEYRKGYKLGTRVLRHAMVVVAN